MRRSCLALLAGLAMVGGCETSDKPPMTPVETAWERPAPPPLLPATEEAVTTAPAEGEAPRPVEIVALINGSVITRQDMSDMLIQTHGLSLLEQLILLIAARQRAAEMSITVTPADIAAAQQDALRRLATPIGGADDQALDLATAERLLDEFLLAKNISRAEWQRRMEQHAWLRKIAAAEVEALEITEAMLREEYTLVYGERVQIRHIQVSSLRAAAQVRSALAAQKDFELVARESSENPITASRGGLMPPFTRNDPSVTPLIREAAFGMEVGQVSPALNEGNWYHIIRLERRFPASDVGFDHVDRDALRQRLTERLIRQRQEALEFELFQAASVDVRDKTLDRQFRDRYRSTQ
jgi:foldase protein PrsA